MCSLLTSGASLSFSDLKKDKKKKKGFSYIVHVLLQKAEIVVGVDANSNLLTLYDVSNSYDLLGDV